MAGFRGPILPPGGVFDRDKKERRVSRRGGEEEALLCDSPPRTRMAGERWAGGRRRVWRPGPPSPVTDSWLLAASFTPAVRGPSNTQLTPPGRAPGVNGPEKPSSGGRGAVMPVTVSRGRSHDPHHVLCSRVTPPCVRKRSGTERDHPTCRKMQGLDITTFPLFWLKINTYSMAISKF